ncbi:hypothetical protein [Thermomonospora cellulosilytica]|uniref:Membrane protein implicated in regulation of membrane protease activity n=1 Tax=Thermomonospora cellulosilytica TaxID=1411118 RepID=A0A7W3N0B8_9ACTN|nr:hypothetical protein [Thermomonospora cellulosilytica]MBA9005202.1 membrane protein implicated in regulation of membrane protease activity [Thermomonospora cellulosilytica]
MNSRSVAHVVTFLGAVAIFAMGIGLFVAYGWEQLSLFFFALGLVFLAFVLRRYARMNLVYRSRAPSEDRPTGQDRSESVSHSSLPQTSHRWRRS